MKGPEKRRRKIIELVTRHDGLSVTEIADQIDVSGSTVRRDLANLDERELIKRTHGGAVPVTNVGSEPSFDQKAVQGLAEKRAIGIKAAEQIPGGQVVFFDSGTTTFQIAKQAPKDGSFTGVTNSPLLAIELGKDEGIVEVTGGALRTKSMSLVGPVADDFVRSSNFDVAYIGTKGITESGTFTEPVEEVASLKRTLISNTAHVRVVAESDKFGITSYREVATLEDVDTVVTDDALTEQFRELINDTDTELIEATVP